MKLAVTCDGTEVSPHFGRCEYFLVADYEEGEMQEPARLENPGHEPGLIPGLMYDHGVECVITGGAGPRALELLRRLDIDIVMGVQGDARDALERAARGELEGAGNVCHH